MHELVLDTSFTHVPGDAADNATRVANGTAAMGLTVRVKVRPTAATGNGTWEADPGCQQAEDAPPVCDDVPDREAFLVPPPTAAEEGERVASASYPLGPDGGVVLRSPEPLRIAVRITGYYGSALQDAMADPSACDRPSGATHRLQDLSGNATLLAQQPRPSLLWRGDAEASMAWHGWCADDAF